MTESSTVERRRFFRQLLGTDTQAPNRAPWHKVPEVGAGDGDVLWSGCYIDGELFVVGDEGMVLHYKAAADASPDAQTQTQNQSQSQNQQWQHMTVPVNSPLHGIWGTSARNLYAVGWMGCLLHYDGVEWQQLRGGKIDERSGRFAACPENTPLFAIAGNAQGQAWAVGDEGVILHFDGQDWQPEISPTRINLRAVGCAGDTVYAAGGEGTVLLRDADGQWCQLECPLGSGFHALLVQKDGSLLLGGGRYFVDQGFRGELVHYKNGEFKALSFENPMPRLRALKTYKEGVLIVGDQGHLYYLKDGRLDKLESNCHHDLMDIIALPTGEALVVGDFGTIMTSADDFTKALAPPPLAADASPWQPMAVPSKHQLWGIIEGVDGSCYACGEAGTVWHLALGSETWQALPAPSDLAVHCLWDSGQGLFAAGQLGCIYRFGGSEWTLHYELHLDVTILGMWGTGPDCIYAVGDEGLILHFDGLRWQRMPSGTQSALYGLWGLERDRLLAPGDFGLMLRYNGSEWTEFNVGTESFLYSVWGDSLTNIYAVGLSGTLAHFNGQRWQQMATRLREDLLSVSGSLAAGAYAVGTRGCVLRLENGQWDSEPSGSDAGLRAVCATQGGTVYAVGDRGTILRRG